MSAGEATTYILAGILGVLPLGYTLYSIYKQMSDQLPTQLPTITDRENAAKNLWQLYPAFPDEEPETALFLLEESKYSYNAWIDSNAKIEAKATWLLGFIGGSVGILTAFRGIFGENFSVGISPFLLVALSTAIGTLFACLYILRPKLKPHPTTNDYISPALGISPMARFHLALSLAEGYNEASLTG